VPRWLVGSMPSRRDALHILVIYCANSGKNCCIECQSEWDQVHMISTVPHLWLQGCPPPCRAGSILDVAAGRNVMAAPWPVFLQTFSSFVRKKSRKFCADGMFLDSCLDLASSWTADSVFHNFFWLSRMVCELCVPVGTSLLSIDASRSIWLWVRRYFRSGLRELRRS